MYSKLFDMSQDLTPELKQLAQDQVSEIYTRFKKHVEDSRGAKLKVSGEAREKEIYSSDVFLSARAQELG